MRFDTPATTNPIDQLRVVGQPTDRIDGRYKTAGTAPYAYERHDVVPGQAYGFVLGSGIAKGHIAAMHLEEARRHQAFWRSSRRSTCPDWSAAR
jgi:xanthine dehydrogenase YagR molybdenum-binding subunit